MKRIFSLTVLSCLLLAGCDDFLDIRPKDIYIPRTLQHYDGMLNARSVVNLGDYLTDYLTDDAYLPETPEGTPGPSMNLYTSVGSMTGAHKIYSFDPIPYTEGDTDLAWSNACDRLFYFNTVINNVLDAEEGSEADRRAVWAEALVQRAVEHFTLVNIYAMHYDPATAADEPGIPIIDQGDISAKYNRSTVAQTYAHILDDLEKARQYLPSIPKSNNFRAGQAAGFAMTAKVYFTMADYDNALTWVEQALAKHSALLDMNGYDMKPDGAKDGWAFGPNGPRVTKRPDEWSTMPRGVDNPEVILNRHNLRPFGLGKDVCPSPELQALFGKNIDNPENDMRWQLWYADGFPPYGPQFTFTLVHGVRIFLRGEWFNNCLGVPEMLLIRAECYARKGEMGKALADMNELRRHRLTPASFVELTPADFGNDSEQVLRFVLEERRRELAFTGNRHIDLQRLNKEARFAKTVVHTAAGEEYRLEPGSRYYMRELWPATTRFNPHWPLNFPERANQTPPEEE